MVRQRRAFNNLPDYHKTKQNDREYYVLDDPQFEPEDADFLIGYVGDTSDLTEEDLSRTPPIIESTAERQKYQLTIGTVFINPDTQERETAAFYTDLTGQISANGGLVDDPNRVFGTNFYSWTPPIDYDKHINFGRYFWLSPGAADVAGEYIVKEPQGSKSTIYEYSASSGTIEKKDVRVVSSLPTTGNFVGEYVEDASSVARSIFRWNGSAWVLDEFTPVADIPTSTATLDDGDTFYVGRTGPDFNRPLVWRYSHEARRWIALQVIVSFEQPELTRKGMIWEDLTEFRARKLKIFDGSGWVDLPYTNSDGPMGVGTDGQYIYDTRDYNSLNSNDLVWSRENWWRHLEDLSPTDRDFVKNEDQAIRPIIEFYAGIDFYPGEFADFDDDGSGIRDRNDGPIFKKYIYNLDTNEIELTDERTTIYQFKVGTLEDDLVLGFPLSFNNSGEFLFELTLESDDSAFEGYKYYRDTITGFAHSVWHKADFPLTQEEDANGLFEVPRSITSNANHQILTETSRSKHLLHMSGVIGDQLDFTGDPFGPNNYRWSGKSPARGATIIDSEQTLLRAMALLQNNTTGGMPEVIRRLAREYNKVLFRFVNRMNQKWDALDLSDAGGTLLVTPEEAVDAILTELFTGRNEQFPYFYADMGTYQETRVTSGAIEVIDTTRKPIFIPPSPPRVGPSPCYKPEAFTDPDGRNVLRGHEGVVLTSFGDDRDLIWLNLQERFFDSVPQFYKEESETFSARFSKANFWLDDYFGDLAPTATTDPVDDVVVDYNAIVSPSTNQRVFSTSQAEFASYDGFTWLTRRALTDDIFLNNSDGQYYIYNGLGTFEIDDWNRDFDWDYSDGEFRAVLRREFERFILFRTDDFAANTDFDINNPFTWNYSSAGMEANYRGIYRRVYNTIRPHSHPWEVVGYRIEPTWWRTQYVPTSTAPDGTPRYSNSSGMWSDLQSGIINPITGETRQDLEMKGPIPVDANGELLDPIAAGTVDIGKLDSERIDDVWTYGDGFPTEQEWIESPFYSYSFALAGYLMKNGIWTDTTWSEVYIAIGEDTTIPLGTGPHVIHRDTLTRPAIEDLPIHLEVLEDGSIVQRLGVNAWVSEYVQIIGASPTNDFSRVLKNTEPALAWRTSGFIRENRTDIFLLSSEEIPFDDIHTLLHVSQPVDEQFCSGVQILRENPVGYRVFGYDSLRPFFRVELPALPVAGGQVENRETIVAETNQHVFETEELSLPFNVFDNDTAKLSVVIDGFRVRPQHIKVTGKNTFEIEDVVRIQGGEEVTATVVTTQSNPSTRIRSLKVDGISFSYAARGNGQIVDIEYGRFFQTPQEVINFMIGYGRVLESEGWVFDDIEPTTGQQRDWLFGAKSFATWIVDNESIGRATQDRTTDLTNLEVFEFSPIARKARLDIPFGQNLNVESLQNGAYGILNVNSEPIPADNTFSARVREKLEVEVNEDVQDEQQMFGLRVNVVEIQHAVFFSNITRFGDLIYDPVIALFHKTLRVDSYRTNDWQGRLEAPGYIVNNGELIPNFEKNAFDFTRFYDRIRPLDDSTKRDQARNLYGWTPTPQDEYMDAVNAADRSRFDYYRGMINAKGTVRPIIAYARGTRLGRDNVFIYEDWAWKLAQFGDTRREIVRLNLDKNDLLDEATVICFGCENEIFNKTLEIQDYNRTNTVIGTTTEPTFSVGDDFGVQVAGKDVTIVLDTGGNLFNTINEINQLFSDEGIVEVEAFIADRKLAFRNTLNYTVTEYTLVSGTASDLLAIAQIDSGTYNVDNSRWILPPETGQDGISNLTFPMVTATGLPDVSNFDFFAKTYDTDPVTTLNRHFHFDPEIGKFDPQAVAEVDLQEVLDPARYNRGPGNLFSNNLVWGEDQVGMLWWDKTRARYVDYRRPFDESDLVNFPTPDYETAAKIWGRLEFFRAVITRDGEVATVSTRDIFDIGTPVEHGLKTGDTISIRDADPDDWNVTDVSITLEPISVTGTIEFMEGNAVGTIDVASSVTVTGSTDFDETNIITGTQVFDVSNFVEGTEGSPFFRVGDAFRVRMPATGITYDFQTSIGGTAGQFRDEINQGLITSSIFEMEAFADFVQFLNGQVLGFRSRLNNEGVPFELSHIQSSFTGSNNAPSFAVGDELTITTDSDSRVIFLDGTSGLSASGVATEINGKLYTSPPSAGSIIGVVVGGAGAGSFTIAGDFSQVFTAGLTFIISGSTGNDGIYTVLSSTFGSPNTIIVPVEAVVDGTVDGTLSQPRMPEVVAFDLGGALGFRTRDDGVGDFSDKTYILSAGLQGPDLLAKAGIDPGTYGSVLTKAGIPADRYDDATIPGQDEDLILPIIGVTVGPGGDFTVGGDVTETFISGFTFEVFGSTGNDAVYTVVSSTFSTPNTTIEVSNVPDGTVDGDIYTNKAVAFSLWTDLDILATTGIFGIGSGVAPGEQLINDVSGIALPANYIFREDSSFAFEISLSSVVTEFEFSLSNEGDMDDLVTAINNEFTNNGLTGDIQAVNAGGVLTFDVISGPLGGSDYYSLFRRGGIDFTNPNSSSLSAVVDAINTELQSNGAKTIEVFNSEDTFGIRNAIGYEGRPFYYEDPDKPPFSALSPTPPSLLTNVVISAGAQEIIPTGFEFGALTQSGELLSPDYTTPFSAGLNDVVADINTYFGNNGITEVQAFASGNRLGFQNTAGNEGKAFNITDGPFGSNLLALAGITTIPGFFEIIPADAGFDITTGSGTLQYNLAVSSNLDALITDINSELQSASIDEVIVTREGNKLVFRNPVGKENEQFILASPTNPSSTTNLLSLIGLTASTYGQYAADSGFGIKTDSNAIVFRTEFGGTLDKIVEEINEEFAALNIVEVEALNENGLLKLQNTENHPGSQFELSITSPDLLAAVGIADGLYQTDLTKFVFEIDSEPTSPAEGDPRVLTGAIDLYEWVRSPVPPDRWVEYVESLTAPDSPTGVPLNVDDPSYVELTSIGTNGQTVSTYYFWVQGNTSENIQKDLPTNIVENKLRSPTTERVAWFAPMDATNMLIYQGTLRVEDDYAIEILTDQRDLETHVEWAIVSENDQFNNVPDAIVDKVLDSLSGINDQGAVVPSPLLNEAEKYGSCFFPIQTIYQNREVALDVYIQALNSILALTDLSRFDPLISIFNLDDEQTDANPSGFWKRAKYIEEEYRDKEIFDVVVTEDERNRRGTEGRYIDGDLVEVLQSGNTDPFLRGPFIIKSANSTTNEFTVEGDVTYSFRPFETIEAFEAGLNNDVYRVAASGSTFDGTDTIIPVIDVSIEVTTGAVGRIKFPVPTTYVFQDGLFVEVGVDNHSIEINDNVDNNTTKFRSVYQRTYDVLERVEQNQLMFSMLHEMMRQHLNCDWFIKTSYISTQIFDKISKSPFVRASEPQAILDNIIDVKPYRTKFRRQAETYTVEEIEDVPVEILEFPDIKITMLVDRLACDNTEDGGWDAYPWDTDAPPGDKWDQPIWALDDLGRADWFEIGEIQGGTSFLIFEFEPPYSPQLFPQRAVLFNNGIETDLLALGLNVTFETTNTLVRVILSEPLAGNFRLSIQQAQGLVEGPELTLPQTLLDAGYTPTPSTYEHHLPRVIRQGAVSLDNPTEGMSGCESADCPGGKAEERVVTDVVPSVNICVRNTWSEALGAWDAAPWDSTPWDAPPQDIGDRIFIIAVGGQEEIPSGNVILPTSELFIDGSSGFQPPYILGSDESWNRVLVEVSMDGGASFDPVTEGVEYEVVEPFNNILKFGAPADEIFTADGVATIYGPIVSPTGISSVRVNNVLLTDTIDYNIVTIGPDTFIDFAPIQPPPFTVQEKFTHTGASFEGNNFTFGYDINFPRNSLTKDNVMVFRNGLLEDSANYNVATVDYDVELTVGPPVPTDTITITALGNNFGDNQSLVTDVFHNGTGGTTTFAVGNNARIETTFVWVNGSYQHHGAPNDYTFIGAGTPTAQIVFNIPPPPGTNNIEVRIFNSPLGSTLPYVDMAHVVTTATGGPPGTVDAIPGLFDLESVNQVMVFLNGELKDSYTATGTPEYTIQNALPGPDEIVWNITTNPGDLISVRVIRFVVSSEVIIQNVAPQIGDEIKVKANSYLTPTEQVRIRYNGWPVGPYGPFEIIDFPNPGLYTFSGDNSTDTFLVGNNVLLENMTVFVDGEFQQPGPPPDDDYQLLSPGTLSASLFFTTPPPTGVDNIVVHVDIPGVFFFQGDGINDTFTVGNDARFSNTTVKVEGQLVQPENYRVVDEGTSTASVVFNVESIPPASTVDNVEIRVVDHYTIDDGILTLPQDIPDPDQSVTVEYKEPRKGNIKHSILVRMQIIAEEMLDDHLSYDDPNGFEDVRFDGIIYVNTTDNTYYQWDEGTSSWNAFAVAGPGDMVYVRRTMEIWEFDGVSFNKVFDVGDTYTTPPVLQYPPFGKGIRTATYTLGQAPNAEFDFPEPWQVIQHPGDCGSGG